MIRSSYFSNWKSIAAGIALLGLCLLYHLCLGDIEAQQMVVWKCKKLRYALRVRVRTARTLQREVNLVRTNIRRGRASCCYRLHALLLLEANGHLNRFLFDQLSKFDVHHSKLVVLRLQQLLKGDDLAVFLGSLALESLSLLTVLFACKGCQLVFNFGSLPWSLAFFSSSLFIDSASYSWPTSKLTSREATRFSREEARFMSEGA